MLLYLSCFIAALMAWNRVRTKLDAEGIESCYWTIRSELYTTRRTLEFVIKMRMMWQKGWNTIINDTSRICNVIDWLKERLVGSKHSGNNEMPERAWIASEMRSPTGVYAKHVCYPLSAGCSTARTDTGAAADEWNKRAWIHAIHE